MRIEPDAAVRLLKHRRIRFHPPIDAPCEVAGDHHLFEARTQHSPAGMMPLGAFSYSHRFTFGIGSIGRYCSISHGLTVLGDSHPSDWVSSSPVFYKRRRFGLLANVPPSKEMPAYNEAMPPVTIGNDVWIGQDVTLKGGITIGDGAIIAARAMVTRDVAPYTVVGGVPARPIRSRFDPALAHDLQQSGWWAYGADLLETLDMTDPVAFLRAFETASASWEPMPEQRQTLKRFLRGVPDA